MPQALAPHFGERDFHAALVADDPAVLHALVLAAQALPVGHRTEDAGTEQPVALRLKGAVVDGLGLGDFAVRPAADPFRRSQADANGVEIGDSISQIEGARAIQGFLHCGDSRAPPAALGFLVSGYSCTRSEISSQAKNQLAIHIFRPVADFEKTRKPQPE